MILLREIQCVCCYLIFTTNLPNYKVNNSKNGLFSKQQNMEESSCTGLFYISPSFPSWLSLTIKYDLSVGKGSCSSPPPSLSLCRVAEDITKKYPNELFLKAMSIMYVKEVTFTF